MAATFNIRRCAIPSTWCGKGNLPPRKNADRIYYTRRGTPYECLRKGIGTGKYTERKNYLSGNSLQHIKYVGEKYEKNFRTKLNIRTTTQLINKMKNKTRGYIFKELIKVFTKSSGGIDGRAYNSTILFLYDNGIIILPDCKNIRS